MAQLTSVACRKCHKGWWHNVPTVCPKCKGQLAVTGSVEIIDLQDKR